METKDIPKEIFLEIKNKLKNYKQLQQDIVDLEDEILNQSKFNVNAGIRSKNKINEVVSNQALELASNEYLQWLKAWKNSIDKLLIYYLDQPIKLKFIKRRYIDRQLLHYKGKGKIKDIYVIKDLEMEGHTYSDITWKRWKAEIFLKLYEIIKKDKNIIKYYKF